MDRTDSVQPPAGHLPGASRPRSTRALRPLGNDEGQTLGRGARRSGLAILFYDRLERVIEDERLHRFLEGVAAGVVGLIAVTAVQLGWNVARSIPSVMSAALIFLAALALVYLWRSKLSVPAMVLGSAFAGAFAFA